MTGISASRSFYVLVCSAQAFAAPWLRMTYFPFLLSLTAFYEQKTVLSLLLLIPFLELANFLRGGSFVDEAAFMLSLISTIGLSLLLKRRTGGEFGNDKLSRGRESTENRDPDPKSDTISDGKIISHYLDLMSGTDDEIEDLLRVAKKAVLADSVNFFMSSGGILRLRCSTDEAAGIIASQGGLLQLCFEKKKYFGKQVQEKRLELLEKMNGLFQFHILLMDSMLPGAV